MKIYKYALTLDAKQEIVAPIKKILDIQMQDGCPVLWALIDESEDEKTYQITMAGTGFDTVTKADMYLGTVQMGMCVWHYFLSEVIER